ncbi:DcrB-related protein [Massilia sp. W12]|uniref:DcrB-related protein n=1 Tax=Massilia sp. W12 TaxID=3126507 RepID=UPI0030D22451
MPKFIFNEGEFTLPPQWEDHTVQRFHLPGGEAAGPASLTIMRLNCPLDKPFDDFIADRLKQIAQFPGFQLLLKRDNFDPLTYCWLDYTWQPDEARCFFIREVIYASRPQHLSFTLSTTPADKSAHTPAWREMIRTVELRARIVNGELVIKE